MLLVAVTGLIACAGGRAARQMSARPVCPPPTVIAAVPRPESVSVVLDGREVDARAPLPLPTDSIFSMQIVSDSAGLAAYGLCPGSHVMVVTSTAEAARRGLRPPPPPLCVRSPTSRHPPRLAVPVGRSIRVVAGQLDILNECDRAAPTSVQWISSDSAILRVDSAGLASARAPGHAEIILSAEGGEARLSVAVVPPIGRIEVVPSDTVITVGDTATFRAFAYGADGQPIPGVPLALELAPEPALSPASGPLAFQQVWPVGRPATHPTPNTIRLVARREGTAWVRAAVVGRVDSARVHAAAR